MSKYTALIVGCGNMGVLNDAPGSGNEHKTISYAKALKENGNFDIYCSDIDPIKQVKAAELWDIKEDEYLAYDVIIIATPDETHYQLLKEIIGLANKPRLVICEKPMCNNFEQAKEIVKLYKEANVPILLDYTRRFISAYRNLIGDNFAFCLARYNRGLLHTGSHIIDLMHMLGVPKTNLVEHKLATGRVFEITIINEEGSLWSECRMEGEPVNAMFDHHTKYVIDNAFNFLEGKEELFCTMYDGLKVMEVLDEAPKRIH